jgi:hypothetical protein
MKRIGLLIGIILLFSPEGRCFSSFSDKTSDDDEKASVTLSEKKSIFDESAVWEKSDKLSESKQSSENMFSDDDNKLYAPPPGENGNPQKIVVPLGSADVTVFLLMSFIMAGYYCTKRNKQHGGNK